jgi:hypothetical protein
MSGATGKESTKMQLSEAQIEKSIEYLTRVTEKPILHMVCETLAEYPNTEDLRERVAKMIRYPCAPLVCEFKDDEHLSDKLQICLSLVQKDYKAEISVPHPDYAKEVFMMYDKIRAAVVAYWKTFCLAHPELINELNDAVPRLPVVTGRTVEDVAKEQRVVENAENAENAQQSVVEAVQQSAVEAAQLTVKSTQLEGMFSKIKMESNLATSFYFNENSLKRAGIFPFYTDKHGQPYKLEGVAKSGNKRR